ncbi:MAG: glycosyltransferase family 2 protein, partial [Nocardioidaceae bacterium]
ALGGFFEPMFAYCEDMELSLRCWQAGWSVRYVPEAVALHAYEFHRNPRKFYLLERNRLLVVLTVYGTRLRMLVLAPLLAMELAVLLVAVRQGWARQKVAGWLWLLRHAGVVRRRRRVVQSARRRSDRVLAELLTGAPGVRILRPDRNTGFAGGCNLGVAASTGQHVALVNPDAVVAPDALGRLVEALAGPGVGLATAGLRLRDRPGTMNSAGNPVHYLGLSWAGGLGEPASAHAAPADVAAASGAAVAFRRETWDRLGGFWEELFAYCEDTELSLRCWQAGLRVVYVPDAVVAHAYEFSRHPAKLYLLERNRLLVVLTVLERRTLLLLAPALIAFEAAVLLVAARQGWAREKLRGWAWLLAHRSVVRRRRTQVQQARAVGDAALAGLLTARFSPGAESGFRVPAAVNALSGLYWALVRRGLAGTSR